ncbi:unnamed protein product [Urochloa humidicola]
MGTLSLPVGVLDMVDAHRRAFFWSGTSVASGVQCLVAWEKACCSKEDGGLGIKQLATQNVCLLLKLIHRLHNPATSSWAAWPRERVNLTNSDGELHGTHWNAVRELLPAYRCITRVQSGDGIMARILLYGMTPGSGNHRSRSATPRSTAMSAATGLRSLRCWSMVWTRSWCRASRTQLLRTGPPSTLNSAR